MTTTEPFETDTGREPASLGLEANSQDDEQQSSAKKREAGEHAVDISRPLLTLQQAAAFLGKSVRALERSILGRWGNRLPEGWAARKIKTREGEEWRIVPPPGFRVRAYESYESSSAEAASAGFALDAEHLYTSSVFAAEQSAESASQNRLLRRSSYRQEHSIEQPTIVIDRSEEVESLLRELLVTQKALSEERRLHMEDLRIVSQLQGQMRFLESSTSENSRIKAEYEQSKLELEGLKAEYNRVIALPWWKRVFGFARARVF